jgi:hypothetical protein
VREESGIASGLRYLSHDDLTRMSARIAESLIPLEVPVVDLTKVERRKTVTLGWPVFAWLERYDRGRWFNRKQVLSAIRDAGCQVKVGGE